MITLRPADTRGHYKVDWIDSYRTFTISPYYDRRYMNFSHLGMINDDIIQPGRHVPQHIHKNIEVYGYIIEGFCRHTDSNGKTLDIPAGAVQRMSCGSGIKHTEGNASNIPNHYIQIWITPNVLDTEPIHEWCQFTREDKLNKFCDITEKLPIKQDAKFLAGIFTQDFSFEIKILRKYYLYVISGTSTVNDIPLIEGDGLSFVREMYIQIIPNTETEIILFELV